METVKFTDELGREVKESELNDLQYFSKTYLVDEKIVKQEIYKDGKFSRNTYHVSSLDEIWVLLETEPSVSFNYLHTENGYNIKEYLNYNEGKMSLKTTSVMDGDNIICYAKYKFQNEDPKLVDFEKIYHANNEEKYLFEYIDGACFLIHDMDDGNIWASSIGKPGVSFTWEGLEYYQFEQPIIPEKQKKAQT